MFLAPLWMTIRYTTSAKMLPTKRRPYILARLFPAMMTASTFLISKKNVKARHSAVYGFGRVLIPVKKLARAVDILKHVH